MKSLGTTVLCGAACLALTAQSPSPPPLRILEYSFSVLYQQTGESHESGIGTSGSGVDSLDSSGGRQGKLDVNIMAAPSDGGLVVRVAEYVPENPRPVGADSLCAVYPSGLVICRPDDRPTDVEEELLQHLGRGFLDPAIVDESGHWRRTYQGNKYKVVTDFSTKDPLNSPAVHVYEHRVDSVLVGVQADLIEDTRFVYDAPMSVPVSIHNEANEAARGAGYVRTTIDLSLVKDSFAKNTQ